MKGSESRTVKLEFASRLEMLDMAQGVLGQLTALLPFDDDAQHYMSVALREALVNAIKHGNSLDEDKRVAVDFQVHPKALEIRVRDEGGGFDPQSVPDPVAPENLLKSCGRGIFFMRSFMDEVSYSFPARGGTVVRMLKRAAG
jgi:serine/threonine-protein kinase RsbW